MTLTAQDIIQIHEDLIKFQSISSGYKNKDDIFSLIDKLDTDIFGTKLYEDEIKKELRYLKALFDYTHYRWKQTKCIGITPTISVK